MAHRDPSLPESVSTTFRYGIAVLTVAIGTGLDFFLLRHFDAKLTPFLFAVAATVWYAGTGPGVLAIILSVLSLNYFFLHSSFSFGPIRYADLVYLTFCTLCALAVGWASAVRRRTERELRQVHEQLGAKVVERTASLQRSQRYLAEAQRLSHTGSAACNETEILYWSDEASRIFGFDPLQGMPSREAVRRRIHPDDVERVNHDIERGVREKRSFANEFRIMLPGGTISHVEATYDPVFSASGKFLEIIATGMDVTERKRAEQALRDSDAKFRDYAENASDWYWETGPDHKFTRVTDYERRLALGFTPMRRIGFARWEFAADAESEPEKWKLHRSMLEARQPLRDFVYRAARNDGSLVYYKISGKPVFDADGEFRGYRGTGTDVTTIMRAQEVLREREQNVRSAFDGIAGLVSIMTPDGELESANRQVFAYFGRSLEELKNWGTSDAVHPDDLPRVVESFKSALASGTPYQIEQRLRRFDGEYRWFETRGVPIRDDSGRIARWYNLVTDIEDRTRALAQLEQMRSDLAHVNRVSVMGELVASLSHEITQPITSARIYAGAAQNFLEMQPPDLGGVREALAGIVGNSDRAGEIIGRVREQVKKAPPRKERFDLNTAINEVIALGRTAIVNKGVLIQTRLSDGLLPTNGDRVQLQQVVLNLLLNAVEAMGSTETGARELLISTGQRHTDLLVAVRDSGPGIDSLHLNRVFDAFYTTKSSGMGMGLSICRSIIDAHGGRLWAEANEPRGTIFQFTLPAA